MRIVFLLVAFAAFATPSVACSPSDFEVVGFNASIRDDCRVTPCPVYVLTGQIKNNCAEAAGAQLKITTFDKNDAVVTTYEGWPASIRNIAPGGLYAFDVGPGVRYDVRATKITYEIIDARTW